VWAGGPASRATDLAMSARCVLWLVGSGQLRDASSSMPAPLAALLMRCAGDDAGGWGDGWALRDELDRVAREAYGPPRYVPFPMPGWGSGEAKA